MKRPDWWLALSVLIHSIVLLGNIYLLVGMGQAVSLIFCVGALLGIYYNVWVINEKRMKQRAEIMQELAE